MQQLLTLAEVAKVLGLSYGTVRNWAWARKIPTVRIGGAVRVPEDDLKRWVEARTEPPRGEKG